MCPFFDDCEDDAKLGGGCDCDGADDFGVDPLDDIDDDTNPVNPVNPVPTTANQDNQEKNQ